MDRSFVFMMSPPSTGFLCCWRSRELWITSGTGWTFPSRGSPGGCSWSGRRWLTGELHTWELVYILSCWLCEMMNVISCSSRVLTGSRCFFFFSFCSELQKVLSNPSKLWVFPGWGTQSCCRCACASPLSLYKILYLTLNLLSFTLKPSPLVLAQQTLLQSFSLSLKISHKSSYWNVAIKSPWSFFFLRLNHPNSLSLFSIKSCEINSVRSLSDAGIVLSESNPAWSN